MVAGSGISATTRHLNSVLVTQLARLSFSLTLFKKTSLLEKTVLWFFKWSYLSQTWLSLQPAGILTHSPWRIFCSYQKSKLYLMKVLPCKLNLGSFEDKAAPTGFHSWGFGLCLVQNSNYPIPTRVCWQVQTLALFTLGTDRMETECLLTKSAVCVFSPISAGSCTLALVRQTE